MNKSASQTAESVEQVDKAISEIAQGATSQAQETQTATENVILMGNMIEETNNEMMPQLRTASALIVEKGGLSSHAAVVGMSLDIPVLLEAKNATEILKQGAFVTVDSKKGIVYANK